MPELKGERSMLALFVAAAAHNCGFAIELSDGTRFLDPSVAAFTLVLHTEAGLETLMGTPDLAALEAAHRRGDVGVRGDAGAAFARIRMIFELASDEAAHGG